MPYLWRIDVLVVMTCDVNIYYKVSAKQCHNYIVQSAVVPLVIDVGLNNLSCRSLALSIIETLRCVMGDVRSCWIGEKFDWPNCWCPSSVWVFVSTMEGQACVSWSLGGFINVLWMGLQTCFGWGWLDGYILEGPRVIFGAVWVGVVGLDCCGFCTPNGQVAFVVALCL